MNDNLYVGGGMKHNSYVKARFFERLIAEIEQITDDDLERIIFLCWAEQQSRMKEDKGRNFPS